MSYFTEVPNADGQVGWDSEILLLSVCRGLAPTCSSLDPVQDATGITHKEVGWKENGLSTFSKGCDTHIQHNLLLSLSFPAETGVCCKVMSCEGCCAL